MVGQSFGRWTVLRELPRVAYRRTHFMCRCSCGAEKRVEGTNLRSGKTKSCGCLSREVASITHRTHGHRQSATYRIWTLMFRRCRNPKDSSFMNYGGRGIAVCERWRDFANFLADMGERPSAQHSIDRINNDGNYEQGNCRWATPKDQAANRRKRSCWKLAKGL